MRKKGWLWLLIVTTLLLAGCWDQRELSTITVVTGMAVDVGENALYKLTVEGINATELNAQTATGRAPSVVFALEGNTIAELSQKMNIGFSRNVIYSHMKTVVISKEVAEKGMTGFIDFLERNREIREDFNFIVAKDVEAAEILKMTYTVQKSSSLKLDVQLGAATENWGADPDVKINDVISAHVSPGRQQVMIAVSLKGDPKKGISIDNMNKVQPDALVVIDSLAMFREAKLAGFLNVEEMRNYVWTQNKIKRTVLSVPCDKKHYFAVNINDTSTKLKGAIRNGRPHIQVNVKAEGFIGGNQCKEPLDKRDTYVKFEKMAKQYLQENIFDTINTVQKDYGIDIFGFGEVVARQDYKNFKKVEGNWDKVFQNADIDVNVMIKIRRSGLETRGLLSK